MESYNKEHADNPIDIQYTDADASAALIDLYNGCYDDIMNLFKPSAIWEGIVRIVPNIPQTLEIAAAAAVIGIVLGFLLALCRIKKFPVLSQFATLYISFMRGTPLLVQLFLSYYGSLISLLKSTSLAFTIGVMDMLGKAKVVAGNNMRYFEVYIGLALLYWPMCILIEFAVHKLEKRFNFLQSRQPAHGV